MLRGHFMPTESITAFLAVCVHAACRACLAAPAIQREDLVQALHTALRRVSPVIHPLLTDDEPKHMREHVSAAKGAMI
jgi:hypothetical protein